MKNRNTQLLSLVLIFCFVGFFVLKHKNQQHSYDRQTYDQRARPRTNENLSSSQGNHLIPDFDHAKKRAKDLYSTQQVDFYCDCPYKQGQILESQCSYKVHDDPTRARRIEWEHIVPASQFGHSFPEWNEGHPECQSPDGKKYRGRKCARKMSQEFRMMEADLYNLVPAVGEVNMMRGNLAMRTLGPQEDFESVCSLKIGSNGVEPSDSLKGFIARTYLYMDRAYPQTRILTETMKEQMRAWDKKFPTTTLELTRARRIAQIQGNINPFVTPQIAANTSSPTTR